MNREDPRWQDDSEALKALEKYGDRFEILICADKEQLMPVLSPYAELWHHHIYPNRLPNNPAVLKPEWMPFGGSHYTALIRLHHAHQAKQDVVKLCRHFEDKLDKDLAQDDFDVLLRIHAACASFWENLGSSIDNFRCAEFEAKRVMKDKSIDWKRGEKCEECGKSLEPEYKTESGPLREAEHPALYRAYQRRTQFIHSRLVPKIIESGMVIFNALDYQDENTKWPAVAVNPAMLDDVIESEWTAVLKDLGEEWWKLHSYLQEKNKQNGAQLAPQFIETPCLSTSDISSTHTFTPPISGSFNP